MRPTIHSIGACLLLLGVGCGPDSSKPSSTAALPPAPLAPSGTAQLPAPTLPTSPQIPVSPDTVYGTVFEYTAQGFRALPEIPLLVRTGSGPYVYAQVTTDRTGRYAVAGVRSDAAVSVAPAPGSGYYAPCPAGRGVVHADAPLDAYVAAGTLLSTAGAPELPKLGAIWISGQLFENMPDGRRPVAGASVRMLDWADDARDPRLGSTTLTDSAGRYWLCPALPGHGTDVTVLVHAEHEGYRAAKGTASLGWDYTGVDIELIPSSVALTPPPPPQPVPGQITVGVELKDTLVGNATERRYELMAPRDGLLALRLSWPWSDGRLALTLGDKQFAPGPTGAGPINVKVPVTGGRTYSVRVSDVPWPYGEMRVTFTVTTSME